MPFRLTLVGLLAASSLGFTAASGQDQGTFSRTPKVGDLGNYTFSHSVEAAGVLLTGDLTVTVTKVPSPGKAELKMHMSNVSNKSSSGGSDSPKVADDRTVQTGAMNIPVDYAPTMGGIDYIYLMFGLAASTSDKAAKVGEETPWKSSTPMKQGTMVLDGTIKVVEVSAEKKTLKAQITAKILADGKEAGTYTNTSTFSLPDYTLVESVADFHVGTKQEIKFTRKA